MVEILCAIEEKMIVSEEEYTHTLVKKSYLEEKGKYKKKNIYLPWSRYHTFRDKGQHMKKNMYIPWLRNHAFKDKGPKKKNIHIP